MLRNATVLLHCGQMVHQIIHHDGSRFRGMARYQNEKQDGKKTMFCKKGIMRQLCFYIFDRSRYCIICFPIVFGVLGLLLFVIAVPAAEDDNSANATVFQNSKDHADIRFYADPGNWQHRVKLYTLDKACSDANINIRFSKGTLDVTYVDTVPKSSSVGRRGVKIVTGTDECQITIDITPTSPLK